MLKVIQNTEPVVAKKERTGSPDFRLGGNKVYFISLGCPRNLVDTEVMIGLLLQAGYEAAQLLEEADFIVINTCGFLESSRQESLDTIGDSIKNRKDGAKVIATGCMVQTHSDLIRSHFPEIHYLLGSGDVKEILKAVETKESGNIVSDARSFIEMGEVPRTLSTPKHYAYLKIAEGCRKRCAFCKIPTIKGPLKSKSVEQIKKEVDILVKSGVNELILIAQDLGDWGKDMGFKGSSGLVELLKAILEDTRQFHLRLLYLYPDEITDELIALMKADKRILPYLDMPIQHINDTVLKAMRRTTDKAQITSTLTKLRKEIPNISIRTSLMVGFPGETEEQFAELCQFITDIPLDNVGIFTFSKEEGTHAATLENQIPEEVKQARFKTLSELQQKLVRKRSKQFIGKKMHVTVEGYHPESRLLMRGRHDGQCPEIDGSVIINDGRKVTAFGKKYLVEITDVSDYDLIGRVL
ncbi:MAG: 30S ribosomal protein S12 methylthiotransferase RimO [Verrucomicrobia bacterium]|nr:30S ribosomal protein S12 methylthiotransferase RimO [Verrucomicrobiota bacterium]MBS0637262.1 30S ribosomal protein S12 methylthiotransferase RimO [Verrucomicrobiota bacterium]